MESPLARPDTARAPGAARRRTGDVPVTPSPRGSWGSNASPSRSSTSGPHLVGGGGAPPPTMPVPRQDLPLAAPSAPPAPPRRSPRTTGETPSLDDRLEGLAARATPPHGADRPASRPPMDEPLAPDPLVDERMVLPGPTAPAYDSRPDRYEDPYGGDVYDDTYGDDDYEDYGASYDRDEPSRRFARGCGRPAAAAMIVAGLVVLLLLIGLFWVRRQIDPGGDPGPKVRVEVVAGQSTGEIGETLEKAGVITNSTVWTWYVRLKGGGDIQAGVYEIPTNLSMDDALKALEAKPLPPGTKRVTVPEGQTLGQIKARLTSGDKAVPGFTAAGFDAALKDPAVRSKYLPPGQTSLEGTFFPDTYDLAKEAKEKDLLLKMRDQFDSTLDGLNLETIAEQQGRSPYEVLVVASLIEEEARVDTDRSKIARVIYNRLAKGTPLQIDAALCYEKRQTPCVVTAADKQSDSGYNVYKVKGLPPTLIAAPGRKSIEAALHPAVGDWVYYVLDPNLPKGEHFFTADYAEFQSAKQRCKDAGLGCG